MAKRKLNLSIDESLHKAVKHIAISEDATVSEIFEDYIRAIQSNQEIIKVIKDMQKTKPKKIKSKP